MRSARSWLSGALLALALAAGAAFGEAESADPIALPELMARLAATPGVEADFEQTKTLALLSRPVVSQGTLRFIPPDCMSWSLTSPGTSALTIAGRQLRFRDAAGERDVDLSNDPAARGFVESFMVLFNGDHAAMERQYQIRFESDASGWSLSLVPRSERMREFLAGVDLAGDLDSPLRRMVLREADGDQTTTVFRAVEIDRRFSADEARALFGEGSACGGG